MTDLRKVVSPLNVPTNLISTNYVKSPEGDREVYYNALGLIEADQQVLLSNQKVTAVTAANYLQYLDSPLLGGTYFANGVTLHPGIVDFRRRLIMINPSNLTLYIPYPGGAGGIIPYLKKAFGSENILPGMSWMITFLNDSAAGPATIDIPQAPPGGSGTVIAYGFAGAGGYWTSVLPVKDATGAYSRTFLFLINDVTTGNETMTFINMN